MESFIAAHLGERGGGGGGDVRGVGGYGDSRSIQVY